MLGHVSWPLSIYDSVVEIITLVGSDTAFEVVWLQYWYTVEWGTKIQQQGFELRRQRSNGSRLHLKRVRRILGLRTQFYLIVEKEEEGEVGCVGHNNIDYQKHLNTSSSMEKTFGVNSSALIGSDIISKVEFCGNQWMAKRNAQKRKSIS